MDFIPAGKEPENDRSVHQVSEEEKEKEKRRIGTVTNGEYTVHLGESREQILEELGKPLETTIADETAALEAAGIFSLCDTYDGVRIYYRSYRRLAEMYEWMDARDLALETFAENTGNQENPASNGQDTGAETDADSETDLVPGTDLLSEMMPGPDLRVVYLYLENGTYHTADGIMCGDTEEDVKKVKTVAGEEQIFEQTLYNGEYLTWDDWNRIFEDFSDDQPSQIRMLLNTRAVSMVMNDAGRSVESIIVGDALAIKYWT